jgi:hypothetical protein
MTKTPSKTTNAETTPAILTVVYGVDEHDKPRAARFATARPELVAKAAQLMELQLCEAKTPELADIAQKLPVGRLYANGRGFVPYVRRDLYSKLITTLVGEAAPGGGKISHGLPESWDAIAAGHLVIAHESLPDGWWEAIVIERAGDMLTLRWRDAPKLPKFTRHVAAVALMSPGAPSKTSSSAS